MKDEWRAFALTPPPPQSARLSPSILMTATAMAAPPTTSKTEISERALLSGLALTSFSALLLELSLTRLFSVVL